MYLDEEIFNSEFNERSTKQRAIKLMNECKDQNDKHSHYDNTNGSLYLFAKQQELNAWEFDIIKRIVRCRKKGQFESDLKKTIDVINLYLKEYDTTTTN